MTVRSIYSTHRRLVVGAVVLAVTAAGVTGLTTNAWFTDTDAVTANTFTVGNVNLLTAPLTSAITVGNMAPGDTVYGAITVSNPGNLGLRYSVKSVTGENLLAGQLALVVKTVAAPANCNAAGWAAGVAVPGSTIIGSTGGTVVFGDITPGNQAGDRLLAAAASEVLCAQAILATTAVNTVALLPTTAVFTFSSEQSLNNP